MSSLKLGRYDYATYYANIGYACCSLVIPLVLVDMGTDLDFPLDDGGMGIAGTLHVFRSIAMLATLLTSGAIAVRIGKRHTVGVSMAMMGLGITVAALSNNFWFLVPCVIFSSLGEGAFEGIATPFVNDLHKPEPGAYVSIAHSFWSVGTVTVVLVTCALSAAGCSWRPILGAAGLMALSSSIPYLIRENPSCKYPETPPEKMKGSVWQMTVDICRSFRFWLYCLAMAIGAGGEFGLTFWSASFIRLSFLESVWAGALGTAGIGIGMFLGRVIFGRLVPPRHFFTLLLTTSLLGVPLSMSLLLLRPEMFTSTALMMTALVLMLTACGVCVSAFWPMLQLYGVVRLPHLDSTLLFIYFSSTGIPGCGIFTWLMGYLGDRFSDLRVAFLVVPSSMLLYALILLFDRFCLKQPGGSPAARQE